MGEKSGDSSSPGKKARKYKLPQQVELPYEPDEFDKWVTTETFTAEFPMSLRKLGKLLKDDKLPHYPLGSQPYINRSALERFMKASMWGKNEEAKKIENMFNKLIPKP